MNIRYYRFLPVLLFLFVLSVLGFVSYLYGNSILINRQINIEKTNTIQSINTIQTTITIDDNGDENISDAYLSRKDRGRRSFQFDVELNIPHETARSFVNTAYGHLIHQRTDLKYRGRMMPVNIIFTYNSGSSFEGRFGNGWQLNYNMRYVTNDDNSNVLIVRSDDRNDVFINKNGDYIPSMGVHDKLERILNGYKLTTWSDSLNNNGDYLEYYFQSDDHNYLTSIKDRNGNEINFDYNNNNDLTKMTADNGAEISLIYLNGRLTKIIHENILLSYTYDDVGNLIEVKRNNVMTAEYEYLEECNKLSQIANPMWHRFNINYDDNYMISSVVSDDNDVLHSFEYSIDERITQYTDGNGYSSKYEYDDLDRLSEYTDAKGQYFYLNYNDNYDLIKNTSSLGIIFQNDFDEFGFVTKSVFNGENLTYLREANFGKVTKVTKQIEGENSSFEYDAKGNLIKVIYTPKTGNQYSITFTNNEFGQVVSAEKSTGGTYHYNYNDNGWLTDVTLPNSGVVEYSYDNLGNVVSISDPKENITQYFYDDANRITQVVNADVAGFNIEYDNNGNIIRTVDEENIVNTFAYDRLGMFRSYRNGLGIERQYKYDILGNMTQFTNGESETVKYSYDELGNLISIYDPLGGVNEYSYNIFKEIIEKINPLGNTTKFEYEGNIISKVIDPMNTAYGYKLFDFGKMSIIDPNGSSYIVDLDYFGHITKFLLPNSLSTGFKFDAEGRLKSETSYKGLDKSYIYDDFGNLIEIKTGELFNEYFDYDLNGNIKEYTDPNGIETQYEFNDLNKLSRITNALGMTTELYYNSRDQIRLFTKPNGSYKFRYDEVYRLSKIIDPRNKITELTYDDADRLIAYKNRMGDSTVLEYDRNSRLTKTTDPSGAQTSLGYDANGNIKTYIDANKNSYSMEYDIMNRLVKITDPFNNNSELKYDAIGKITDFIDPIGESYKAEYNDNHWLSMISKPLSTEYRRYVYSPQGRPNTILANGNMEYTYEYDLFGNIAKVTYPDGLTSEWAYNNVGLLTDYTDRNGNNEEYEYNDIGRLTKKIYPDMNEINFKYDIAGNLWQVVLHDGRTLYYAFNSQDNLVDINYLNKTISEYLYNDEEKITWFNDINGIKYNILYDNTGRVRRIDAPDTYYGFEYSPTGKLSKYSRPDASLSFTYNKLDLQEKTITHDGFETQFEYDPNGNLISSTDFIGNNIEYEYDPLNRLVKESFGTNEKNIFTYDANNLNKIEYFSGRSVNFEYDDLGRITRKNDSFGVDLRTTYDGLGNIKRINLNDIPTEMTYDNMSNLTEIKYSDLERMNFEYDEFYNLTKLSDEYDRGYTFEYDENQFTNAIINPFNEKVQFLRHFPNESAVYKINPLGDTTKIYYNSEGQIIKQYNPLGHRKQWEYNSFGLITKQKNENNAQTLFRYDGLGRLDRLSKATGSVYNFAYDNSKKTMTMTDPKGYDYVYHYDDLDNIRKIVNPKDQFEQYYINKSGNMTSYTDADGNAHRFNYSLDNKPILYINPIGGQFYFNYQNDGSYITSYGRLVDTVQIPLIETQYDELGRLTGLSSHGSTDMTIRYDGYSRLNKILSDGTTFYEFSYDLLDRLKYIQFSENQSSSKYDFLYDDGSYLRIIDGPNEINTKLRRDDAGRITQIDISNEAVIDIYPDPVGNIHKLIDNGYELNFVHNHDSKLLRVRYPDLNILDFTYDPNGNLTEMTNTGGSGERLVSIYNEINETITDTMNYSGVMLKAISYKYDNAGNLTMLFDSDRDTSRFTYNGLGQLVDFDNLENSLHHRYNKFGDLTNTEYSNGLESFYSFSNQGDLILKQVMIDDTTLLMDIEYAHDEFGRVIEANFDTVNMSYEYDDLGRIIKRTGPNDDVYEYDYNRFFGINTLTLNGQTVTLDYDSRGRLVEYNGTNYLYDQSGRLSRTESTAENTDYTYDEHGRLKTIESENGRRTYLYSGLNDLIGIIRDEDLEFHLPFGLYRKHEENYTSVTYKVYSFRSDPISRRIYNPDKNILNDQILFSNYTKTALDSYFAHNGDNNNVLKYSNHDSTEVSVTLYSQFNEQVKAVSPLDPNPLSNDYIRDDISGLLVNPSVFADPVLNHRFGTYRTSNLVPEYPYEHIQIMPNEIDFAFGMSFFGENYNYNTHNIEEIPFHNEISGEKYLDEVLQITPELGEKPKLINPIDPMAYSNPDRFSVPNDSPEFPFIEDKWHNFSRFVHIDFNGRVEISHKVLQRQSIDFNQAITEVHRLIDESMVVDYSKYENIINEIFIKENPMISFFVNRKADRVQFINDKIFKSLNKHELPNSKVKPLTINVFGDEFNIDVTKFKTRPVVFSKDIFPDYIGNQEKIEYNYLTLPVKPDLKSMLPVGIK